MLKTKTLTDSQKEDILKLWNEEYPQQIKHSNLQSLDNYLNQLNNHSHLLLVDLEDHVKGWYFQFERNGETWFAMILSSKYQGQGYGSQFLNNAKREVSSLSGWVVDHDNYLKANGKTYHSPLQFYLKNGFELIPNERSETDNLSTVKVEWTKPI